MALVVQRGGLRFADNEQLWDAVRRGEISIEDDVIDESSPLATPVKVIDVPPPKPRAPRINGWYVLGGLMAVSAVNNYFELPAPLQIVSFMTVVMLGLLRLFDRNAPKLPRGWENVFRRRR